MMSESLRMKSYNIGNLKPSVLTKVVALLNYFDNSRLQRIHVDTLLLVFS